LALLLPVFAADPQISFLWGNAPLLRVIMKGVRVLAIIPFCCLLGFVTPMLVDRWSGGNPERAGRAYAVNVVGCILGPLLSGFLLLPFINERWVLFICAVPWLLVGVNPEWWTKVSQGKPQSAWKLRPSYALAGVALAMVLSTNSYETRFRKHAILRDDTAASLAVGEGMQRRLLVNGRGMTHLTPITKMMAHLTLVSLDHPPQNALTVCFGMGTTFRSMLSWQIQTTAVELVPSVPRLFWYFHEDAQQLLTSPLAHVEIDDGRRFLERTPEQFDVIVIDPPPPVESAGSSLLYSKEFYSTAKPKLKPGGILQQWFPAGDKEDLAAVARALLESFTNVRAYRGVEGWGIHFLASDRSLPEQSPEEMVRRMPVAAVKDMMEWGPEASPELQFERMLSSEIPTNRLLAGSPQTPAMHDDRPVNEYFLLRRMRKLMAATLGGGGLQVSGQKAR
jgi:spermidine synthase